MGRPTKREKINKKISAGVSKMTPENVEKLKYVFRIDGNVTEACFYTGIHRDTYYEWLKKHPELSDEFEACRQALILKARREVVKGLDNDPYFSLQYIKIKCPNEFH